MEPQKTSLLFFPGHAAFQELFPPKIMSRQPIRLHQSFLDNRLSRNSGVIESWYEKRREPPHSMPPNQSILERKGQRVSNVKLSSNVGRRSGDNEGALFVDLAPVQLARRETGESAGLGVEPGVLAWVFGGEGRDEVRAMAPPAVPGFFDIDRIVA